MIDLDKIILTQDMLSIISELDEFRGRWETLGKTNPQRLSQMKKIATIESIGSSTRIEGVKLSDQEVEKLLSNLEAYSFKSRDEEEVAGYAYVCEEIFQGFEFIALTENVIKQLHKWLLQFSNKDERHRGWYKKLSNNVEAFDKDGKSLGVIFETASPFETPLKMQELIFWTSSQLEQKTLHPLIIIGIFTVVFLAIHPFQDGNGRLSRILTNLLLLKSGYDYASYSSLESIIEQNKESYYLNLRKTQSTLKDKANFTPWLIFFLRSLQKQKNHLEKKITLEKSLLLFSKLDTEIITLLREHERLGITEIEKMLNVNRNTLKKHLANLVNMRTITRLGKGKATWYISG